jgi:hypothetical protein
MSAKLKVTRKYIIDDEDFFKDTIQPDQENDDDFDYTKIFLEKNKFSRSQITSKEENKSVINKVVNKTTTTTSSQSKYEKNSSSSECSENERAEGMKKIISSMLSVKRHNTSQLNSTNSSSSHYNPFKKANSFTTTSTTKITEKLGHKKDLDKLYPISDDDSSDNDANVKVYNREESAYHENKIKEYTNQMNEVKLAEKKAKWLNLDDFKSDDDDDDRDEKKNSTGNVEPKIEQQSPKTPLPFKVETKREKKAIECLKEPTHEVNNNNNNSKNSNCETMSPSSDEVIEVDDYVKTEKKREFNRRTIDRDDKIEARLEKVK